MRKSFEKYTIVARHFKGTDDSYMNPVYQRVVSVHNNLNDAINELLYISSFDDPSIMHDADDIKNDIEDCIDTLEYGLCYNIPFSTMHDYMPEQKKWYWGPGTYAISKTTIN